MTIAATQALLTTIYNQLNGRPGVVHSVTIERGEAVVVVSWEAFQDAFSGASADTQVASGRVIWSKKIGSITYQAIQVLSEGTQTVPAS